MNFQRIDPAHLNSRQRENYNFQKVSALLADFGFMTIRLSDDWNGADFIAQHIDGIAFLKIQLKGRLYFDKKYQGKDLWIAFPHDESWYLYPHDSFLIQVLATSSVELTSSWRDGGAYSFPRPSKSQLDLLKQYKL